MRTNDHVELLLKKCGVQLSSSLLRKMTGDDINRICERLGITQVDMAKRVGVGPRTMRAYISGEYQIPWTMAALIRLEGGASVS